MIEVTAAILEKENKIMIARRKPGQHLAGYWEFPGGKIEKNETPENCLVSNSRELGLMEKWFCIWEISDNPKIIALFSPTIAY
jgi:mutator protein MutT